MLLTSCDTQQSKLKVHINILGSVPGVPGGYLIATSHILRDTWQSTIGLQTAFVNAYSAPQGYSMTIQ